TARRSQVDERFDPDKALAATGRYLKLAKDEFGREDLAVVSYHMGIGNLQHVLGTYGDDDASYAQLYFDASPDREPRAYRLLAGLGDDSKTYYWRVLASRVRAPPRARRRGAGAARARAGARSLGGVRAPPAEPDRDVPDERGRGRCPEGRPAPPTAEPAHALRAAPGLERGGARPQARGVRARRLHRQGRPQRLGREGAAHGHANGAP